MAMRVGITLFICILSLDLFGYETSENYPVKDLADGSINVVTMSEDLGKGIVTFFTNRSVFKFSDVRGVTFVKVFSDAFLQVDFAIRGGSGERIRRSVLMCISQGEIYKTLDILSENNSILSEVYNKTADSLKLFNETDVYSVKLSVEQTSEGLYKCILKETIRTDSKHDPSRNFAYDALYDLKFDAHGFFFYNVLKPFDESFFVYSTTLRRAVTKSSGGNVPCVQLYRDLYLHIDGDWCTEQKDGKLVCP